MLRNVETIWWKYTQRIWWWKNASGFHWTKRIISSYNLIKLQIQMFIVLISVAWFHCCYENCDLSWTIFSSMREWRSWWDFFTFFHAYGTESLCFQMNSTKITLNLKIFVGNASLDEEICELPTIKSSQNNKFTVFFRKQFKSFGSTILEQEFNKYWKFALNVLSNSAPLISTFCLLCTILNITFGKYLVIAKNTTIVALSLSLSLRSCQHDFGCAINISQTNDEFATPF